MKILMLCALVVAVQPVVIEPPYLKYYGSIQYRNQDNIGNYNFGYKERHTTGSTFRRETGDAFGNKVGSYGLKDADDRVRVVNYVADSGGFRTNILSNEPGVEAKDPANTSINKAEVIADPLIYSAAVPATAYAVNPVVYNYGYGFGYYGDAQWSATPYYNYYLYYW